ncbi:MAG: leucine-rich repeat protein [Oscillospiraceae bacterium]|nr:leucine-rich repeat protein [Oscillospiraceae bacterium]
MGNYAFYQGGESQILALPDGLTSIGEYAFAQSGLKFCVVPDSVTECGGGVFIQNTSLTSITL